MKKITAIIIVVISIFLAIIVSSSSTNEAEVNIQAAASMQNALDEIIENYDGEISVNYGGSGTLVTQIQEGAPADIFISASMSSYDNLKQANEIKLEDMLVNNKLVLITNTNSQIDSLDQANTIAIGTPDAVPAGTYAMQVIEANDLTDEVSEKLVQTKDVSEVLTYVETGNADLGFVYNTDALSSDDVKVIYEFDDSQHDSIEYPIGLLTDNPEAKQFYDYLLSDDALTIFEKYGFVAHE
ncbi:molybdate ABC transporter substrate-binding protein [Mollicutes bacterium LVI A0078]|nr:molybdate ABC transporter substrate-binding protein [Mollicutes bacterium LVI A0075]WOO91581.1 molybdate ABC transporter substrate-binding protein [Mollicutes bacterium LVI A0078]